MKHRFPLLIAATLCALSATIGRAQDDSPVPTAAPADIQRTLLQSFPVPEPGHQTVFVRVDLAPNVQTGRHTHPGPVAAYVMYGSIEVFIDGEPPRLFRAGESFMMPAGVVHDERTAATGAKVIASFLVPEGAPLAVPVQ